MLSVYVCFIMCVCVCVCVAGHSNLLNCVCLLTKQKAQRPQVDITHDL
jgi:hypothetical protein